MIRPRGATLVVGLILLSLVTLLGLAGASTAHVETQLAQNEQFREAAAAAASAGLEVAVARIAAADLPAAAPSEIREPHAGTNDRYEVSVRFAGFEAALPQEPGNELAGAHFEIVSTGYSARRAVDRQVAGVMRVVRAAGAATLPCGEDTGQRCWAEGDIARLSWRRVTVE